MRVDVPPGNTFVWFTVVSSATDPAVLAEFQSLLSEEERRRCQAFHFDADRHLYLVAHALLRTSLSRYSDVPPADWTFSQGEFGRPEIASQRSVGDRMRFNLSHTGGLAACVIARGVDVGIDVECIDRQTDSASIASRYFSHTEAQQLLTLPEDKRHTRFLEYWTLKEAYVKACGGGLSIPLDRFHFQLDADREWRIGFADADGDPKHWQFSCLRPTASHIMSIAIRHRHEPRHDVNVSECAAFGEEA